MADAPRGQQPHRYLGLELAGAKNQKTTLAALEYYPKEGKIFLLDIYDKISGADDQTGDEALLEVIQEIKSSSNEADIKMGVNVPLAFPPCVHCTRRVCPLPKKCTVPAVKWMRDQTKKAAKNPDLDIRVREFTPYTQRPIELWVRYQLLSQLPEGAFFEIDETLGGNKAPLTARMAFLIRQLKDISLVEVWPKLTVAVLASDLGISKRHISTYRHLEEGIYAREEILEKLIAAHDIFIYDRDLKKLAASLTCFDAFICAYTALMSDRGQTAKMPSGFPLSTGWIEYPELSE